MTTTFRRFTSPRLAGLALVALLAAACDGSSGSSSDGPPPPRVELRGELRAAEGGASAAALRLALAWYPGLMSDELQPFSQPGAIHTQDVAYAGGLPQAFTYLVDAAPPAAALRPMPEGWVGKGAVGVLLAYGDGNGNGKLDPIPEDGPPVDHVYGASLDWAASPAFLAVWLTDDQPAGSGLVAGMNLLKITDAENTEVVPLTTAIPISVSEGGALLDLFVCEAAWDGSGTQLPCGLDLEDDGALDAELVGEIYVSPDMGEAAAAFSLEEVVDGETLRISDAVVTLGGVEIAFDPWTELYYAEVLDPELFSMDGDGTVELVATRGEEVLRRTIPIPGFAFTHVPETVVSGTAFDVTWSVPASADSFSFVLFGGDSFYLGANGLDGPKYRVAPEQHVGEARISVTAFSGVETSVTVVRTTTLEYVAAQ